MTIFRSMGLSVTIQMWIVLNKKLTFWRYSKILKNPDPNGESWYGSWWFMMVHGFGFATFRLHDRLTSWLPPGSSGFRARRWCLGGTKVALLKKTRKNECLFLKLGENTADAFPWNLKHCWTKVKFLRAGLAQDHQKEGWHGTKHGRHTCASNLKKPSSLTNTGLIFLGFCVIFANKFSQKGFHPRGQLQNLKMESSENGLPLKSIVCHNLN